MLQVLANHAPHPESVPINALVPVKGTVLGDMLADTPLAKIDEIEFVRTVAVARITMPYSMVRLSAGRGRDHGRGPTARSTRSSIASPASSSARSAAGRPASASATRKARNTNRRISTR